MDYTLLAKQWVEEGCPQQTLHFDDPKFHSALKKYIKSQEKSYEYYMITFTLKDDATLEEEFLVQEYIERIPERKALHITKAHIVKERTKKGRAHWHMSIETCKKLKKDRFAYYVQKYGNVDISRNKAQQYDEMVEYMSKSDEIKKLK